MKANIPLTEILAGTNRQKSVAQFEPIHPARVDYFHPLRVVHFHPPHYAHFNPLWVVYYARFLHVSKPNVDT